jgi:hypothetical protein
MLSRDAVVASEAATYPRSTATCLEGINASAAMWTTADSLRLTVLMGLRKGLKLCRGMRRALSEDEQQKVAGVIVEQLEQSNWKIDQGPASEGHGQKIIPERRE